MSLWLWTTQPNHIKKSAVKIKCLTLQSGTKYLHRSHKGNRTFTSPLGQWTAAATTGLSCLLSSTMSFNFLPYTSTSFYSPDFSPFSSLGLQLVRACACVCVLARVCLCACAYWKCCGQNRGSLLSVCDEYTIGRHGEPGSRRKQKQADRHQGVDRRKS